MEQPHLEPQPASKPHLRSVDPETGEVHDECPACVEKARTYAELERKYRGALSQIGNLRADHDAEARAHVHWPIALAIFRYWQQLLDHPRSEWSEDRFWLVEPHLRRAANRGEDGAALCRSAIRGLANSPYHAKTGRYANRDGPKYDEFDRVFKTSDSVERFAGLDPESGPMSLTQKSLIEHARMIAGRVLERAKLIEGNEDPVAVAHLLIEIDRLNAEWRRTPLRDDR